MTRQVAAALHNNDHRRAVRMRLLAQVRVSNGHRRVNLQALLPASDHPRLLGLRPHPRKESLHLPNPQAAVKDHQVQAQARLRVMKEHQVVSISLDHKSLLLPLGRPLRRRLRPAHQAVKEVQAVKNQVL